MRKLALLLALLLAASLSMAESVQPKVGIKGGLALTNLTGGDADELFMDESPSTKLGIAAGLFVGIPVGSVVIQPEVWYVQKGAKVTESGSISGMDWEATATAKVDYVEIPLLLKFPFGTTDAKPYLMAGPALGILTSAKVTTKVTVDGDSDSETIDINDITKDTDFGLVLGVGVDIKRFILEARYELGLSSVADTGDSDVEVDVKNTAIVFALGYTFN